MQKLYKMLVLNYLGDFLTIFFKRFCTDQMIQVVADKIGRLVFFLLGALYFP